MAIKNFSKYIYTYELAQNDQVLLGKFKIAEDGELAYVRPMMFIYGHGSLVGGEKIKIEVFNDSALSSLYDQSEYELLSNATFVSSNGPSFLGWFSFELTGKPVQAGEYIYPRLTIADYVPVENTFAISIIYDFPVKLYTNAETTFYRCPFATQIFLKQVEQ